MASDGAAFAALDDMIARIRSLPDFVQAAVPEVAAKIGEAVRGDLQAGRDPGTGEAWAPTKDGHQAMQGAAGALEITTSGTTITLLVGQPYVFHHYGVRGAPPRHVVPDRMGIKLGRAIRIGLVKPFRKHVG